MSSKGKKTKGKEEEVAEVIVPVKKNEGEAVQTVNIMDDLNKKQAFKKFSWRGKDINQLLAMKIPELM